MIAWKFVQIDKFTKMQKRNLPGLDKKSRAFAGDKVLCIDYFTVAVVPSAK